MSELITRTARLTPYAKRPRQMPSFVTAYAYEPLPDDPGFELGNLYVVLEVLIAGRGSEELADLIIETVGDKFYNQAHHDTGALTRFEAAIKTVNHDLGEYVSKGNAAWIGKLSAIVAVQCGTELHVAQTGSAEAFLYRGKASTHISSGDAGKPATPTKTFGSIASGELEPSDRLLLATPALVHQVPIAKLGSVVGQSGPNAAIAELTELLKGTATDRVAALVIELTTPELAALQVRSEQPSEIQLGSPENALQAAKLAAAPIAQTTVASGKNIARTAHTGIMKIQPHVRAAGLKSAERVRDLLSTKGGRKTALISVAAAVMIIAAAGWYHGNNSKTATAFSQYQSLYAQFEKAQGLIDEGNKIGARELLQEVDANLASLKASRSRIDNKLKSNGASDQHPKTFEAFAALIKDRIDQIDGLVKTNATTVATLDAKNAKPSHLEIAGGKAYVIDPANNNALSIVTLASGTTKQSSANTSKLGVVLSTTLSSNNDGIFILSDKPGVWFYRFDNDRLTEQTVSFSQWPKSKSIASFASNIYLLGDTAIFKHVKNATGFSPKSEYLRTTTEEARDAASLAVDGSVYVASTSGIHRYIAGKLKQSSPLPASLTKLSNLKAYTPGATLLAISNETSRVGLWTVTDNTLTFRKQVALQNAPSLTDASYDATTRTVYALTGNRLVRVATSL